MFSETKNDTGDGCHDNHTQGPELRKAPLSFGAARFRRRGQTLTNPPLRILENEPIDSHSRRPSTSWLRRLSIVSFQSDNASNSPVTPSLNESASPILPRLPSQRKAPNKLVKRPSSQHSSTHPLLNSVAVSPVPASRRPATSHQRSETIRLHSPSTARCDSRFSGRDSVESPQIQDLKIPAENEWRPYLLPKTDELSEKLTRRLPAASSPMGQGVRRIISDQGIVPALVLATAIATKISIQPDKPTVTTAEVESHNLFQPKDRTISSTAPQPPPPEKPAHKHSHSLNDVEAKRVIVNTVTASGTPILGRPRGGSLKRVKGRTFSITRSEFSKPENVIPDSPPPQRRNVTDPNVFCRPQAMSPPGMTPSALGQGSRIALRSVSQDYNIGMHRQRPLTTDAVALSAWQHSTRPDPNLYPSLLRRCPKRHSIAASDPPSTVIGSDDTRVFTSSDEYETDIMTDYWDSIRTRETSGSGLKGLRIETMFDKAEARLSNEEVMTLEELLPRGSFASRLESNPPLFPNSLFPALASPTLNDYPSISKNEPGTSMIRAFPGEPDSPLLPSSSTLSFSNRTERLDTGFPSANLSAGSPVENSRAGQKMNIFDWSEQPRTERDAHDTETRPRTVHGKQNGMNRGSRAVCRKVPSSIHLRSQSVPVARDLPTSDSRQTSGKFGTWGLGSKGVSEDWDSDFDFDDTEETSDNQNTKMLESNVPPQRMTVPQAILERQASLRGQFGQVQELTLLVEELKRLRHQASVLDLVSGPSSELWKEAEGIVNLATIDDEEDRRSPPGSPSSLTFSFDDSDDEGLNVPSKRNSEASWQSLPQQAPLSLPLRQLRSISEGSSQQESQVYSTPVRQLSRSSPRSKSVLDFSQPSQRAESSILPRCTPATRPEKLPFDTSSLRNLVVRAGVVTRALKEVIRKAEGVDPSPQDMFPSDPPFRRIFDQPSHDDLTSFEAALAEMQ